MLRADIETRLGSLGLSVRLELDAGRTLALVGPSGAGKSSVLRAIAGLLRPRRGMIESDGQSWLDTDRRIDLAPERRRCGYLFQDYALFDHLSVARNVAFGLGYLPRSRRRAAALELLARFGVDQLADAAPPTLSGGERQRVALARTLGSRPRALLLDEPLSALDSPTRLAATQELRELIAAAAVPTILVTHDFGEAISLAEKVAVIEAGRLAQQGSPEQLAAAPATGFVAAVTGAIVLEGEARQAPDGGCAVDLGGDLTLHSSDRAEPGAVAVAVAPWDIGLELPGAAGDHAPSANRIAVTVRSVTAIGPRVRVELDAVRPLLAEITPEVRRRLAVEPGRQMVAVWAPEATRVVPR